MRKVFLLTIFFLITPIVLVLNLALLSFYYQKSAAKPLVQSRKVVFAALPEASGMLRADIVSSDARIAIVQDFFKKYKSDLFPYATDVVGAADKYGLDFRLIPAIAMQESNLCKKLTGNLKDSHNCWGFGIYGKKVTKFDNYPDAIDTVTRTLANQYVAKGLVTPEQIMTRYTPGSNGSWANGVNEFMDQLSLSL